MISGDVLFYKGDLRSYLGAQVRAIEPYVKANIKEADLDVGDDALVERLLAQAYVKPLQVDFKNPTKTVDEKKIEVLDFGQRILIDGVRVTRTYQFVGEEELFYLRPSTWTSVLPHGTVHRGTIMIAFEGRKNLDGIKAAIEREEKTIQDYIGWQAADIDTHNKSMPATLMQYVQSRKKHLSEIRQLRSQL